jgi:hypothetical protein
MITFNETDKRLLFKEASLIAMNLGNGLTAIRQHDFTKIGYFYQACFSLSIGLERLMKLILIYDYYGQSLSFPPDNKYLKNKGHNLIELLKSLENLFGKYNMQHQYDSINSDDITKAILENLSDFATHNRYFHLNRLSNGAQNSIDPLIRWNEEINKLIIDKHYKPKSNQQSKAQSLSKVLDKSSIIHFHNEQDNLINSFDKFFEEGYTLETKQKYSSYYVYKITKMLCELQEKNNIDHHSNAFLYEFFSIYKNPDDKYILSRKIWNPYKL